MPHAIHIFIFFLNIKESVVHVVHIARKALIYKVFSVYDTLKNRRTHVVHVVHICRKKRMQQIATRPRKCPLLSRFVPFLALHL